MSRPAALWSSKEIMVLCCLHCHVIIDFVSNSMVCIAGDMVSGRSGTWIALKVRIIMILSFSSVLSARFRIIDSLQFPDFFLIDAAFQEFLVSGRFLSGFCYVTEVRTDAILSV